MAALEQIAGHSRGGKSPRFDEIEPIAVIQSRIDIVPISVRMLRISHPADAPAYLQPVY